MDFNPSN